MSGLSGSVAALGFHAGQEQFQETSRRRRIRAVHVTWRRPGSQPCHARRPELSCQEDAQARADSQEATAEEEEAESSSSSSSSEGEKSSSSKSSSQAKLAPEHGVVRSGCGSGPPDLGLMACSPRSGEKKAAQDKDTSASSSCLPGTCLNSRC